MMNEKPEPLNIPEARWMPNIPLCNALIPLQRTSGLQQKPESTGADDFPEFTDF